jgi:hypothetical protein
LRQLTASTAHTPQKQPPPTLLKSSRTLLKAAAADTPQKAAATDTSQKAALPAEHTPQ